MTKSNYKFGLVALAAFCFIDSTSCFSVLATTKKRNTEIFCQASLVADESKSDIVVALTREDGKNGKLHKALSSHPRLEQLRAGIRIRIIELPCIAHADGPDTEKLGVALKEQPWDYVAITSPEAARVLSGSWNFGDSESEPPKVVAVGKATQKTLEDLGIPVAFCPSKATAQTLVDELPATEENRPTTLLYPASAKAKPTLQNGLIGRGFDVTRLDTYDTVKATWSTEEQNLSNLVTVVCVGSPSALNGWLENTKNNKEIIAACIGETSYEACIENNLAESNIFYPEKPGIAGWAEAVVDAVESIAVTPADIRD
mmetsp:Transcript_21133/g.29856  ORF Transcript_21133/g.29856 Transcript_21133/m.29856 type:complete len:315 (+) Transcript_21133:64-1008(+)